MKHEQGYTDGGRNPHYDGLFDGETDADKERRVQWAINEDQLPWPGMMTAFENYYGQSWFDRDWRAESSTWAAAWKAAKNHGAQAQPAPSIPDGWLRAVDEALVVAHIGVANESDTYEQAKAKLNNLICFHVDVATDPAVNGGYKLVPLDPTYEMLEAGEGARVPTYIATPVSVPFDVYRAMLEAAPEAKP